MTMGEQQATRNPGAVPQIPALPTGSGDGPPPESPRVVFVTDIPTPYLLEVLRELSRLVRLSVLFCAGGGSRAMPWNFGGQFGFRSQVVGGATIGRRSGDGQDYHLSPRILGALARSGADAVVSFGFSIPSFYAAAYCRLRGVPLIIYSEGTHQYEVACLGRHHMLARAILLREASACVALSKPAAERFLELGAAADRVFMAPHTSNMAPLWEVGRERRYDERSGELRVLTAGRLIPRKGVDRLLRAVGFARAECPGIRLRIVGVGPEEQRLRHMASELGLKDVEFAGFVEQSGLPAEFAQADAFAFPTLSDPFGIVLLEAAAAGLPLLTSPHAGATLDLVRDGKSGLIVDPDDTKALASALVELARDTDKRRRLGRAAHLATLGRGPAESARGYVAAIETTLRDRRRAVG